MRNLRIKIGLYLKGMEYIRLLEFLWGGVEKIKPASSF
jgi:hypothetical protein